MLLYQNIDTAALQGNIISDGLTAVTEVGRVSLLANGNVDFNGRNTLTAKGDINAGSVGKGRLKMDNTNINASAGDVKLVSGGQLDLGNGNQRNTVNGGHISLDSSKGSMVVQNIHLNARASLKVDADQTLTINNSKLNSGHNTQINVDHGHMALNQLDAHSRRHMSISAQGEGKGKGSGQILQNDQQNSKSTLVADGVLSLNSSALQVLDNTTLRGGAINIKAGGGIIKRGHIDWETQDTATMRSAELKPLAGMMSIESGGDNPLTVEPGNRIVSAGDLAVKHNSKFQISARAGNNGNPSAQTASVLAKGNIGIVAGEVDIDAANIAAGKDLALVATKGNISLNSIRNTFSNYQSEMTKQNISQQIFVADRELSKLTSAPKYREAQDRLEALRREYFSRGDLFFHRRDLTDSERFALRESIRASRESLSSLRPEMNAAEKTWNELQSPVKALVERKQSLQQALLTVSQPGRGHENQGSTLSGQNIKLLAAGGIRIQGSKVAATQQANIQAAGFLPAPAAEERQEGRLQSAIDISGVFDTFEYGQQGSDKYAYAIFSRPSEISGKTGVTLSAPNANENSRISLSAADIEAENGKIKIQSYGDQYYYAGQGELFTFDKHSYKTGKFYNRKHITEIKEHQNAKADPVNLRASQGIEIRSGGSIDVYATQFDAPKGAVHIEAGRKLTLRAVDEINYNKLDSHKKRKFLGITYDKVHDTSTQLMQTTLPSRVVAESANLQSGWDTKLQGTQFETTLGSAVIRAGVGDQARADAKIILEGIKSSIHTETVSSSKSALWQKQAGRGSNIETLQLPSFTGPVAPVLSAPGGYIVDIPKGNLKTEIEKLAKQPEYAYLKQLQVAKNVNWNQVQLAYDKWDYKQEGLTGAGAAIVVIIVTVLTYGYGAAAAGSVTAAGSSTAAAAGTAATTTAAATTTVSTAAAMQTAALASLYSQAAVSIINNKGDVGKALKDLGTSDTVKQIVTSALTAGALNQMGADIAQLNSKVRTELFSSTGNQTIANLGGRLAANLSNAGISAGINTAVNGGSLKDNLEANLLAALVNTAHGEAASKIKGLDEYYIAHKVAHAVAGCAAAAANKGKCQDGAIGAAVGEIAGEALLNGRKSTDLTPEEHGQVIAYSKLIAGMAAAVAGGDADAAAKAAEVAVKNNQLSDKEGREFDNEMTACAKQNNPQLCRKNTVKKYQNVADKRLAASIAICTDISRSTECRTIRKQHLIDSRSLHSSWEAGLIGKDDEWYKLFSKSYTQADLALQSYHLNTAAKSWLQSGNTKPLSEWMADQGYTLISGVNPRFIPIPRGFVKQNTPITNVKYPEGISFDTNLKRHLANADSFSQKQGIKGAHNRTNFMAELNSRGGRVKSETQTDIEGITRIKYEIPTLDRTGKPDGGFKEISSIKTVYDPKKFSDDKILQMAQKAASQGYSKASKIAQNERTKSISERKNVIQFSETFDGIKFRSYFDVNTGRITNIHPE